MREIEALTDMKRLRRGALVRRVLDTLRTTVRVTGYGVDERPVDPADMRLEMTDDSVRVIAPLIEAVEILEDIIWASDGCVGHRQCGHTMEPWQRARALLQGKWESETSCGELTWEDLNEQRSERFLSDPTP